MIPRELTGLEIAVIGFSCRFPGSGNPEEFWDNLIKGNEGISHKGIDKVNNIVHSKGILNGHDFFDFEFFGYTRNEAEMLDPQIRIMHECAWEALEDAGYNPFKYEGLIGNYMGASANPGAEFYPFLKKERRLNEVWSNLLFSDKDFISTRISNKLNLRGPSITIDTACSTSLVAVDIACQGLLTGKCDIALAGGVSITFHDNKGYLYKEGMISSPDGHCRPFDENAGGTVTGNGAGVIVLKRLDEAIEDKDQIAAVILGSAVNNDGSNKMNFTAPSKDEQSQVIKRAHIMSDVDSESITFIEAHGTGTKIGDPIEIDALKEAFKTNKRNYCAIGSVKSNIGHLDVASGIAGFIKTVLCIQNKQIPPTLHFQKPNSKFNLIESPFFINNKPIEWLTDSIPRRAGISSFGIGGTNAHVVLEEPQNEVSVGSKNNRANTIILSAKSETAILKKIETLHAFLKSHNDIPYDDVCYTLQIGRESFKYRYAITADSNLNASSAIEKDIDNLNSIRSVGSERLSAIFMFSGQGSQYTNMGLDLYRENDYFRQQMDRCFEYINTLLDIDIRNVVYPQDISSEHDINSTLITQPLLFAFEYSLAKLMMKSGITPSVLIGHSIGEYVAACISEVFSLEDAIKIVVCRAKLMCQQKPGKMLSVQMPISEIQKLLPENTNIAAINCSDLVVVSGEENEIIFLAKRLKELGHASVILDTSHAFHSFLMEPAKQEFELFLASVQFKIPKIPYISNLTGDYVSIEQIKQPSYWGDQMIKTVNFSDGLDTLLLDKSLKMFIEIGPGRVLSSFVSRKKKNDVTNQVFHLIRQSNLKQDDFVFFIDQLGKIWKSGQEIEWDIIYNKEKRSRISLPVYPFDNKKLKIPEIDFNNISKESDLIGQSENISDWTYLPLWEQSFIVKNSNSNTHSSCLVFTKPIDVHYKITEELKKHFKQVLIVNIGDSYQKIDGESYRIGNSINDYEKLFKGLIELNNVPETIVHLWNYDPVSNMDMEKGLDEGLYSLLYIARSIGKNDIRHKIKINVVTCNLQRVFTNESIDHSRAPVLGPIKIIPLEYQNLLSKQIDIEIKEANQKIEVKSQLISEILSGRNDRVVAYRNGSRWLPIYKRIDLSAGLNTNKPFRIYGVYIVTGGLGGMAYTFAKHLIKQYEATVYLIGRSLSCNYSLWDEQLTDPEISDDVKNRIRELKEAETNGHGSVFSFRSDISDEQAVKKIFDEILQRSGRIDGVLHTAAVADEDGVIQCRDTESIQKILKPKIYGTLVLDSVIRSKKINLDFLLLFSSNGNIIYGGKYGQVAYNAANEFLDAFASTNLHSKCYPIVTINWNDWYDVGMTVDSLRKKGTSDFFGKIDDGIFPAQGIQLAENILSQDYSRVVISNKDIAQQLEYMDNLIHNNRDELLNKICSHSPTNFFVNTTKRTNEYKAPRNNLERIIADEIKDYTGFQEVDIHDNFFEIGLTSLDIVQLNSRLIEKLKIEIPVVTMFSFPTIDLLVNHLNNLEDGNGSTEMKGNDVMHEDDLKLFQRD